MSIAPQCHSIPKSHLLFPNFSHFLENREGFLVRILEFVNKFIALESSQSQRLAIREGLLGQSNSPVQYCFSFFQLSCQDQRRGVGVSSDYCEEVGLSQHLFIEFISWLVNLGKGTLSKASDLEEEARSAEPI